MNTQQLDTAIGQMGANMLQKSIHDMLYGNKPKLGVPIDAGRQQRLLAAQQLNNSGIYLLRRRNYPGAINEFKQALAQDSSDAVILQNLHYAQRLKESSATAGKTSDELSKLLGKDTHKARTPDSILQQLNTDPSTVDFRGMGTQSWTNPNASALQDVVHGSDGGLVDLRGTTRTSVDAKQLQSQVDGIFGKKFPATGMPVPPPDMAPAGKVQEIYDLFHKPQAATASTPQRNAERLSERCSAAVSGSATAALCQQKKAQPERARPSQAIHSLDSTSNEPHN